MTRKPVFFFIIFILTLSCKQKTEDQQHAYKTPPNPIEKQKTESIKADHLEDFSQLVPIEIVDSAKQNVYEKFGIEFSGNCYSCDLARISIRKKQINFINICDDHDFYSIKDFSYTSNQNELEIKTNENIFILKKIDPAPIYKLEIKGKKILLKNKRISEYFTTEKSLHQFSEHDCGDFQG